MAFGVSGLYIRLTQSEMPPPSPASSEGSTGLVLYSHRARARVLVLGVYHRILQVTGQEGI